MSLPFPNNASNGDSWEDQCGNKWIYNKPNNSWAKPVDPSEVGVSPFVRDQSTGEITPRNDGDDLDMTSGNYIIESLEPLP